MIARKLISQDVYERSRYDLDTQRAAHDIAKLEMSYTEIRAPIGGVVSKRNVKVGNLIQVNQPLFKIDDFDPLEAMIDVPEREMRLIKSGQPVQMLVDAGQPGGRRDHRNLPRRGAVQGRQWSFAFGHVRSSARGL
jgi:membrane fusion protein (multidrug efflux system)